MALGSVRWVVFDVGETLVDETRLWTAVAGHCGVPVTTLSSSPLQVCEQISLGRPRNGRCASRTPSFLLGSSRPRESSPKRSFTLVTVWTTTSRPRTGPACERHISGGAHGGTCTPDAPNGRSLTCKSTHWPNSRLRGRTTHGPLGSAEAVALVSRRRGPKRSRNDSLTRSSQRVCAHRQRPGRYRRGPANGTVPTSTTVPFQLSPSR